MASLVPPTETVRDSFLDAMDEFRADGRGGPDDESMIGRDLRVFSPSWHTTDGFAAYLADLRADADPDHPRPEGWVTCTTWWWVHDGAYLGRIAVRHRLTARLREFGGHIGYDVRPTARRRGHATAMLGAVLPLARSLGIGPALLTCDADNAASRRVIEVHHGELWDQRDDSCRYWVPTTPVPRPVGG